MESEFRISIMFITASGMHSKTYYPRIGHYEKIVIPKDAKFAFVRSSPKCACSEQSIDEDSDSEDDLPLLIKRRDHGYYLRSKSIKK